MGDSQRESWLEEAMEKWTDSLLRICYAYLGDKALAEDALQETFLKAWKSYDRFRGEAQEKTWLMRIAINTCKDYRRTAWFRHIDNRKALDELPPRLLQVELEDQSLSHLVMALPARYKQVVLLYYFQGLTQKETAEAMDISPSAVIRRLRSAEKLLRQSLTGDEELDG